MDVSPAIARCAASGPARAGKRRDFIILSLWNPARLDQVACHIAARRPGARTELTRSEVLSSSTIVGRATSAPHARAAKPSDTVQLNPRSRKSRDGARPASPQGANPHRITSWAAPPNAPRSRACLARRWRHAPERHSPSRRSTRERCLHEPARAQVSLLLRTNT